MYYTLYNKSKANIMAYVDNIALSEALLESHMAGHITVQCNTLFDDMVCQRVKLNLKYNVYEHREAMHATCMDKLARVWQNYCFDRDNPFAYFITVIDNAIKQYYIDNQVQHISLDAIDYHFNDM